MDNQLFLQHRLWRSIRESSLPLISTICKHRHRLAALCLVCTPSQYNPTTTPMPKSVPTWDQGRSADNHCFLLQGSSKPIHLTSWNCPAVNSAKHLPLDSLGHDISEPIAKVPTLLLTSTRPTWSPCHCCENALSPTKPSEPLWTNYTSLTGSM